MSEKDKAGTTDLEVYRDLGEKAGRRLAESRVKSAHDVLMGNRAIERDARENAHDKQREEKKK